MRKCSYFRAIGRSFMQMIAYFLVMDSKRCTFLASTSLPSQQQLGLWSLTTTVDSAPLPTS